MSLKNDVQVLLSGLDQRVDGLVDQVKLAAHRRPWAVAFPTGVALGLLGALILVAL